MPLVPDGPIEGGVARVTPPLTVKGLTHEDINPDAMDNLVMRLFTELRRQLSQLEAIKEEKIAPEDRGRNARILAELERTLERLTRLEAERAAARKSKALTQDGNARKALEDRIDCIIAVEFKTKNSGSAAG